MGTILYSVTMIPSSVCTRCGRRRVALSTYCVVAVIVVLITYEFLIWTKRHESMSMRIEPFLVQAYLNNYQARLLPDLTKLRWPVTSFADRPAGMRFINGTVFRPLRSFEPVMSRGQNALSKRILGVFSDLMFANGLGDRFFLNAGTLLGSFRHHDIIPWDEDVDVLVDLRVRPRMHQLFRNMNSGYLYSGMYNRDKLFTKQIDPKWETEDLEFSRNTSSYPWFWPFLDIGYYVVNETHVYELALYGGKKQIWPRDVVFPLLFRPLGMQWFPTPFRAFLFLNATVPFTPLCHLSGYDHILEVPATNARCTCFELRKRYAFVRRRRSNHHLVSTDDHYWNSITLNLLVTEEQLIAYEAAEATGANIIHSIHLPAQNEDADLDAYDYSNNMEWK